jgi:predicted nucleic acid-binding protein
MGSRLTPRLLLESSAWARLSHRSLPDERAGEIADALEGGDLVVCLPFLLEAGYFARDTRSHELLCRELLALPWAGIDAAVERRAVNIQRQLARSGHHRLPPVDLLIAATAERHGLGVLHYDRDYDVIAARTDVEFESVWLAEPGTI